LCTSLSLEKTVNLASAYTGQTLNWTITVNNVGLDVVNVTLNDTNGQNYAVVLDADESYTTSYTTTAGCSSVNNTVSAIATNIYTSYTTSDWALVSIGSCGNGVCDCGEGCHSCGADCGECECSEAWSCGSWGSCDDGEQARTCSCGCPDDADCTGDSTTTRSCDCDSAGDCAAEACKIASCVDNECQYANAAGSCNDGDACTTGDTCSAGLCSGTPINCDDGIDCTTDSCVAGTCQHASACACLANSDCDDSNPCTADTCAAGTCQNNATEGSCDDGDDCTEDDFCQAGSCASGVYVCPCEKDNDCDDDNACTDERCNDDTKTCEVTKLTGTNCNDGDRCTSEDTCDNGKCKGGKNVCKETGCTESWSCSGWSSCTNGKQTRSCRCSCPDEDCIGDGSESRSCTEEQLLELSVSTDQGLNVGDVLRIRVTDQNGNPITGKIILIRPDGTTVDVEGDTYVVDQAGVWKILVEKEGYQPAEAETSVVENVPPAADLGSQLANAVREVVEFITKSPVTFSLLLVTVIGIIAFLVIRKRRRAAEIEKI